MHTPEAMEDSYVDKSVPECALLDEEDIGATAIVVWTVAEDIPELTEVYKNSLNIAVEDEEGDGIEYKVVGVVTPLHSYKGDKLMTQ